MIFIMCSLSSCALIYRTYKTRVETEFTQGVLDFNHAKYLEAMDHFETVVSIDPAYPQAEYYRRVTETILNSRRDSHYNTAVEQQKRQYAVEAMINLRQAEHFNGDRPYKDTEARINSLLRHEQILGELADCNRRGTDFLQKKNHAAARIQFQRALLLDPSERNARTNLNRTNDELKLLADAPFQEGLALMKQDRPDVAAARFQQVIEILPDYKGAAEQLRLARAAVSDQRYYQAGLASFQSGNQPLALEYFSHMSDDYKNSAYLRRQSLDGLRNNVDRYFQQAVAYYEGQRLNESRMVFKWILAAVPDHEEARKYLDIIVRKMETLRKIEAE